MDASTPGLVCRSTAGVAVAVGVAVLAGWALDIAALKSVVPGWATMKANTALGFVCCGLALALRAGPTPGRVRVAWAWAWACAALALAIGMLTLAEYALGRGLGIDDVLFRDPAPSAFPGRPSIATAASFGALATALLLIDWRARNGRWPAQWLAVPVALNAYLALLVYVFGVDALYRVTAYSSMALHTALLFVALSVGLLCARPERGIVALVQGRDAAGLMVRRLLPAALLLPPLLGWLRLLGERAGWYPFEFGLALFAMSNVVVFVGLVWWTGRTLRRSETRYRTIVETAQEGIWQIDAEANTVFANAGMARMLGTTVERMAGSSLFDFVDAESLAAARASVERRRLGQADRNEFKFRRADGEPLWAIVSGNPLHDDAGRYAGALEMVADIGERRQAELALRASEERLQAVIDNLSEGLIVCAPDGQSVSLNRAARAAHGLADGEDPGAEAFRAAHEMHTLQGQPVPVQDWPLRRLLRGEDVNGLELRMRRRDGAWERVFAYGGALLRDPAGSALAFLTVTDITERKHAEAQVLELNQALEQRVQERTAQLAAKSKELESFCYSVSHDLKAPLRGIDGYSRLLQEDHGPKLGDEGRRFIDNVRSATRQMTDLIEDLLAYSRQERRTLASTPIDLQRFVGEQLARQRLELEGVALVVQTEPLQVRADPDSLGVALRNLLDNARKFSARAVQPSITVRTHAGGDRCVISVQDNGSGFDMRYHDKIFEIFQRLHRAEDYPGTGVGLALVRKAMERMGGRVWAHSAPGAGATFFLELPAAHLAPAAGAAPPARGAQHA